MNTESQILNVPIEDIIPNRFQPRLTFDESGLKELASSIKEHGIIQPLVLRRLGDKYEIIAGERRYKASKIAGLTSVPAIISEMDDKKSAEVAIVENIQRRDLTAIEEAKSYKALLDKGYLTQEELAKKMGISQSAISNKLRLLTLDESVQNALMEGQISERHARSLLKVSSKEEQAKWLRIIIEERLTVQNLEKRLKNETNQDDEIPIIEVAPSVEDIRANATDIINSNPNPFTDIIVPNDKGELVKPMPNKFFNFLEDESANMNVFEPIMENPVNDVNNEEEIEMLDFLAPEPKKFDSSKADELMNKLKDDLKNFNYKIELVKDDNEKELRYTIVINKE